MNTINEAHNEVKERLVKALDDAKHRMLLLDLLSKHPGSYEALIAFAEECEPVYNGTREVFEYALDELAPELNKDGRLSFEIPYSRYAWNAEAKAWQIVEEDDEEDEEEEPEDVARFRSHERLGERLSGKGDDEERRALPRKRRRSQPAPVAASRPL